MKTLIIVVLALIACNTHAQSLTVSDNQDGTATITLEVDNSNLTKSIEKSLSIAVPARGDSKVTVKGTSYSVVYSNSTYSIQDAQGTEVYNTTRVDDCRKWLATKLR